MSDVIVEDNVSIVSGYFDCAVQSGKRTMSVHSEESVRRLLGPDPLAWKGWGREVLKIASLTEIRCECGHLVDRVVPIIRSPVPDSLAFEVNSWAIGVDCVPSILDVMLAMGARDLAEQIHYCLAGLYVSPKEVQTMWRCDGKTIKFDGIDGPLKLAFSCSGSVELLCLKKIENIG